MWIHLDHFIEQIHEIWSLIIDVFSNEYISETIIFSTFFSSFSLPVFVVVVNANGKQVKRQLALQKLTQLDISLESHDYILSREREHGRT